MPKFQHVFFLALITLVLYGFYKAFRTEIDTDNPISFDQSVITVQRSCYPNQRSAYKLAYKTLVEEAISDANYYIRKKEFHGDTNLYNPDADIIRQLEEELAYSEYKHAENPFERYPRASSDARQLEQKKKYLEYEEINKRHVMNGYYFIEGAFDDKTCEEIIERAIYEIDLTYNYKQDNNAEEIETITTALKDLQKNSTNDADEIERLQTLRASLQIQATVIEKQRAKAIEPLSYND